MIEQPVSSCTHDIIINTYYYVSTGFFYVLSTTCKGTKIFICLTYAKSFLQKLESYSVRQKGLLFNYPHHASGISTQLISSVKVMSKSSRVVLTHSLLPRHYTTLYGLQIGQISYAHHYTTGNAYA